MGISKITRNYQVTLSKDVREMRDLHIGDQVLFVVEDGRLDLIKLKKNVMESAAGLWNKGESGIEYERRLRKGWSKRRIS